MSAAPQWDEADLVALQSDLLRFARIQTGNDTAAEDLAQETLLAALRHREQFQGRAQLKTWLFAILKNKITDHLRQTLAKKGFDPLMGARPMQRLIQDTIRKALAAAHQEKAALRLSGKLLISQQ